MKLKALIAEFIGTFCLLFAGVGSIVICDRTLGAVGPASLAVVALAHGLAIAVCGSALGHVSGGHFNPAVSLGLMIAKKVDVGTMLAYWVAQALGALLGTFAVQFTMPDDIVTTVRLGVPDLHLLTSPTQGLVLEALGTFFLVLVVFGTAVDKRGPKAGAWFIGLTITAMIFTFGPLTGTGINPARWLGPSAMIQSFQNPLVYVVGPMIGAVLAAVLYTQLLAKGEMDEDAA